MSRVAESELSNHANHAADSTVPDHPAAPYAEEQPNGGDSVTIPLRDHGSPDARNPDPESPYGDTLTQTSITKLLAKKFKVSVSGGWYW